MLPSCDVTRGELWSLEERKEKFLAVFVKSKSNGDLVFERRDVRIRCHLPRKIFILMHSLGRAVRVNDQEPVPPAIEPGAFEPELPTDTPKVKNRKRKYKNAITKKYYVDCVDLTGTSHSIPAIERLIAREAENRKKLGLGKAPGASSIIRYCRELGEPGNRPLHYFLDGRGGDQKAASWDAFVLKCKREMIDEYYSPEKYSPTFVKAQFRKKIKAERGRRPLTEAAFKGPCNSTIQNWIDDAGSPENWARRDGKSEAVRQAGAIHPTVRVHRPLECVVLDHTQIDMHIVVLDANGNVKTRVSRPWLIVVVDVYSRMILAANLTLEHPSIYTLMTGIKQTLRYKDFLEPLNTEDALAWATDGWGKFFRMLVDNGLENVGRSLQSASRAVGLNVSFAPVKTPEYKAVAERLFKTLNTRLWHEALGGVRHKPGQGNGSKPAKDAEWTIDEAQKVLWEYIVTVHHLKTHSTLEMPPALMWKDAFKTYRRPMVDNINVIDDALGRSATRDLTRSGIYYQNQRFFDPDLTNALFDDLAHLDQRSSRDKELRKPVSIKVEVIEKINVEGLSIYNPVRKTYWVFPNVNDNKGSYEDNEIQRSKRRKSVNGFYSQESVDANHAGILSKIRNKRSEGTTPADDRNSPHSVPAEHINELLLPHKGPRRGGRKATEKAMETRRRNRAEKQKEEAALSDIEAFGVNAADAAANLLNLEPAERFAVGDRAEWSEKLKAKLRLMGG